MKNKLLIIGHTFPEATTTAAGVRMMQLITLFQEFNYQITFASAADTTQYSEDLRKINVAQESIQLNDSSFDEFVLALQPQVVIYDRFTSEEQYGWRVAKSCPNALRILDTEDLHFLRKAREESFKRGAETNLFTDIAKREIASILRCDLSLIISSKEMELLTTTFSIPHSLLFYLPLFVQSVTQLVSFEERSHFITIGNFKHAPNLDAVHWLHQEIWPKIKSQLPDAELHVYGAYASQHVLELHNTKTGFLVKGWAPSVSAVMQQAKVCLAPLRFGAGLKGKLLDAAKHGTPAITTSVGNEGLFNMHIEAQDEKEIANQAVAQYQNIESWNAAQKQAITAVEKHFSQESFVANFSERMDYLQQQMEAHRRRHFIGQILQHQSLNASKYLSKWIEEKHKKGN